MPRFINVRALFLMTVMALLTAAVGCGGSGAAAARKALPSKYPAKVRQWNDDAVDEVEFLEPFSLGDYTAVVLLPLDTSKTPMPPKDNTYDATEKALGQATANFARGLRAGLKKYPVEVATSARPPAAKVLLLRGIIVEMTPGSRAQRFWMGYGVGQAGARIQGELVDGPSGRTLVRFDDRRAAARATGSYYEVLEDTTRELGEDAAVLVSAFAPPAKK
jgi:hypothetical protein